MDEPTNHLDLKSVILLEEMLRECRCALLLVSHDEVFLSALTDREWTIAHGSLTL
jgi:ATPase subunit of ABC transporter with duplicated ATPase domains